MATNITQGKTFTDTGGRTGVAQFNPNTGQRLSAGQTVTVNRSGGSSGSSNNLTYAPGSLETMTVQQAKDAGRYDEYMGIVNNFPGGGGTRSNRYNIADITGGSTPVIPNAPVSPYTTDYKASQVSVPDYSKLAPDQGTKDIMQAQDRSLESFLQAEEDNQMPSMADEYARAEKQAKIAQKQQLVSDFSAQINAISAQGQADILAARNQSSAEGGTGGILSAREDAINRSVAIKVLPLEAQRAAAQDNLEYAQERLNTLFDLKVKDAEIKYQHKQKINEVAYNHATSQQKILLDSLRTKQDQDFTMFTGNVDYIRDLSMKAMQDGNATLAAKLGQYASDMTQDSIGKMDGDLERIFKNYGGMMGSGVTQDIGNNVDVQNIQSTAPAIDKNLGALTSIFQSNKVTATNKTSIGKGLSLLTAANDLAKAAVGGEIAGLYPGRSVVDFFTPEFLKRKATVSNEALISALDLQTQFWASGAALTDKQTEQVLKLVPTKNDSDKAVKTKVNQLVNYMLSQTASALITDGITFRPETVDLFDVSLQDIVNMEGLINNTSTPAVR